MGPSKRAQVEAIVRSISPSRGKFFDGELSDGEAIVRVVGFDKDQLKKLSEYCEKQQPCLLRHCEISEGRYGKPEVIIKSFTKVEPSGTNFVIPDPQNDGTTHISLVDLPSVNDYDRVSVTVSVLKVKDIETVGDGKQKQEIIVSDSTAKATLIVWEDKVNTLTEHKSYKLHRIQVHVYAGKHQLQIP